MFFWESRKVARNPRVLFGMMLFSVATVVYHGDLLRQRASAGKRLPLYDTPKIQMANNQMLSPQADILESVPAEDFGEKQKHGLRKTLSTLANDETGSRFQDTQKSHLCGSSWQEEYSKLHDDILNSRRPPRFLVYSCEGRRNGCGGYGNRIEAISSLFFLAVLTKRAFLIDWNGSIPIENFLKPKNIQWDYSAAKLSGMRRRRHYWGKGNNVQIEQDVTKSPTESYEEFKKWVAETNFLRLLHRPIEIITSFWFFAPIFRRNKYFYEAAKKLGNPSPGHQFSMIGCAFDFLFQKTPELEKQLTAARESLGFAPGVPKLGIHVRLGDSLSFGRYTRQDVRTLNFSSFFTCAVKMEQKVCQADPKFSEKDIKWFVATDSNEVKTYAKKNYPSKVRTLDIKLEHIALKQPSAQGLLGVLLDNFLLSESDFIIMSMSSFSKTALGLSFLSLGQHSTYGKKCSSSQQAMPSTRPGATNFTI